MSRNFDVSKLTPLPNYVVNALGKTQTIEGAQDVPQQITLPQPILSPLPPIPTVITQSPPRNIQPSPDRKPQPPPGTIQLPDIPQTSPARQPTSPPQQPTMYIPTALTRKTSDVTLTPTTPLSPLTRLIPTAPVVPVPNPEHQFTQELQLAPLSPRSPRIERRAPPTVVTHPVEPTQTETCCICYDEEIPTTNLLTCRHPVCGECTAQLRAPKCPMCQQFLEGPLITDVILADIMNREEQERLNEITANYLAGIYLEEHPEANPEEVYERYRN